MCYCNSVMCTCGGYPRTVSGMSTYYSPPYNPMEDAYRIALRSLEDSFEREMMTINRFYPMEYDQRHYYYDLESEARYRFEKARNRLHDEFRNTAQQYMYRIANQGYGYGLRQNKWVFPNVDYSNQLIPYQYTYTYLNSKETTPVPTETKKWIIISSEGPNDNPKTHTTLADAEKEAQRLARKFPAQEFTIYETKKAYKIAEKPVDVKVFV